MATKLIHQKTVYIGAAGFVIAVFLTKWIMSFYSLDGLPRVLVALLPAFPLTYWWWQYPSLLKKMDELEQTIELEALAKGAGIGLWFITLWALSAPYINIPNFPLFLVAPIIAVFYGIARWIIVRKYK